MFHVQARTYVLGFSFLHVYLRKLILDCVFNSATLPSGHTSNPNNEIAAIVLLFANLIFFPQVIFHGIVTGVVLLVAALLTAGYVETCQNLDREVK